MQVFPHRTLHELNLRALSEALASRNQIPPTHDRVQRAPVQANDIIQKAVAFYFSNEARSLVRTLLNVLPVPLDDVEQGLNTKTTVML